MLEVLLTNLIKSYKEEFNKIDKLHWMPLAMKVKVEAKRGK